MGQQPSLPSLEDPCQAQAMSVTALIGVLYLGLPSCDSALKLALSATWYGDPKSHGGWSFRPHSDRGAPAQGWPPAPADRRRGGLRLDLTAAPPPAWGTLVGACTDGSRGGGGLGRPLPGEGHQPWSPAGRGLAPCGASRVTTGTGPAPPSPIRAPAQRALQRGRDCCS